MLLQCMMGHVVPTFVSLLQAVQVQLIACLFAGVLLKRSEGLCGRLDSSPRSQRLLLEARGGHTACSRGPCWPQGTMGVCGGCSCGGHAGGVAEVEQSVSVFRPQQLHDWTGTWSIFRTTTTESVFCRSSDQINDQCLVSNVKKKIITLKKLTSLKQINQLSKQLAIIQQLTTHQFICFSLQLLEKKMFFLKYLFMEPQ